MFDKPSYSQLDCQGDAVLSALKEKPTTTAELRDMGVFSAAVVVKHLRNKGNNIVTSKEGVIAKYALFDWLPILVRNPKKQKH